MSQTKIRVRVKPGVPGVTELNGLSDVNLPSVAQGDIIYRNATEWVKLSAGTSGYFLKTLGASANPEWESIPGGGDMLSTNNLSDVSNAGTSRANLGVTIGSDVQAYSVVLSSTTASYTTAEETKLSGIETSATADQSDSEIETAYSNQVAQVSAGEVTAGTETALRTFSPEDVKDMVETHSRAPTLANFTASGTWTKPAGLTKIRVTVYGAGGGGGGVEGTSSNAAASSGGPAGGSAFEEIVTGSLSATEAVTIGAGGAGGAAGQNAGVAGGTTSFGALLSATGGAGGASMPTGTSANITSQVLAGTGSGGDLNMSGGPAEAGIRFNSSTALGGAGGSTAVGGGGSSGGNNVAGSDGGGYGAGGGGSSTNGSTNRAGGDGAPGLVLIEEFYETDG